MTKEQILEAISRDKQYYDICKTVSSTMGERTNLVDDLYQSLFMSIFNLQEDKLQHLYITKALPRYYARIAWNEWRGKKDKKSSFMKLHTGDDCVDLTDVIDLDYIQVINEDAEENDNLENYIKEFESLNWFDKQVYQIYVLNEHSLVSLAKETNLTKHYVNEAIKRVKAHLKSLNKTNNKNIW